MEFTTDGIVIKETNQGENDKLLTVLTSTHGKITVFAKGVRKITAKNAPACQLFVYSEFDIVTKGNRNILKTAVAKQFFYNMRSSMERFSLGCYFAEVAAHVCMENNDETEALRLILNTLYALSEKNEIPLWQIKGAFEMALMSVCGYMPDLEGCSCSGQITENAVFSLEDACLICNVCKAKRGNIPFSFGISLSVIEALRFITSNDVSKYLNFKLGEEFSKEFSFICENYLLYKTEKSFETLKIYKSVINS